MADPQVADKPKDPQASAEQHPQAVSERRGGKKTYRLKPGHFHTYPNAEYKEGMEPSASHIRAGPGSVLELTDEQFKSFRHKFEPTDGGKVSIVTEEPKVA